MKTTRKNTGTLVTGLLLAGLTLNFNACTQENVLNPEAPGVSGKTVQSNLGTIQILEVDAKYQKAGENRTILQDREFTGIDENILGVYYFNEETDLWEFVGGEVDKKGKKVTAYLNHFSRYAVAWSN